MSLRFIVTRPVLHFAPPPTLHLKLGLTNLLMSLIYTIDPSYEDMFEQLLSVFRKGYHNKVYKGLHCTRIPRIKVMLPYSCVKILQSLQALNNKCSAAIEKQLGGALEKTFRTFMSCYTVLCNDMRLRVTPKTHTLLTHVLEYVRESKNTSIGRPKAISKVIAAIS